MRGIALLTVVAACTKPVADGRGAVSWAALDAGISIKGAVSAADLYASGGLHSSLFIAPFGQGISIVSQRGAGDGSADFYVQGSRDNSATAHLVGFTNLDGELSWIANDGSIHVGSQYAAASFVNDQGGSGSIAITVRDGFYLVGAGKLPSFADDAGTPYGGIHGDNGDFIAAHVMDAGFLFQVQNAGVGQPENLIDFRAANVQLNPTTPATFDKCGARAYQVPSDQPYPGQHFMAEFDSAHRWGNDHTYYTCEDDNPDGGQGFWGANCTSTNGKCWTVGSVTIGGGGTATAAAPGRAYCQCTPNAAHLFSCTISGGTLTATGTAGDVITYTCQ